MDLNCNPPLFGNYGILNCPPGMEYNYPFNPYIYFTDAKGRIFVTFSILDMNDVIIWAIKIMERISSDLIHIVKPGEVFSF
ncbi:hypothetical protein A994_01355 [Methanobacterium formicicum DSM 3637]|uniref:Uncharacterized protein n=1 Tax=Methanobacterium formicicum (strain DSM 3637 / PP1) TaxID=1204725 RepID=K2QFQ7_METFP|nr:hypothetical protein A994_01355 [Methanobacterium formicicum DSM 3637]